MMVKHQILQLFHRQGLHPGFSVTRGEQSQVAQRTMVGIGLIYRAGLGESHGLVFQAGAAAVSGHAGCCDFHWG